MELVLFCRACGIVLECEDLQTTLEARVHLRFSNFVGGVSEYCKNDLADLDGF